MTGARLLVSLLAAAALTALIACGARPQRADTSAPPLAPVGAIHDQIVALDQQIAVDRDAQGGTAPDATAIEAAHTMSVLDAVGVCARPLDDTCGDVCTLSDSICGNASKICDLAGQLPGDDWAAERCDAGKATCVTASQRCCACAP
ncbi:MAG: hypothetical protein IPL61_08545 [Myxococcales bacterium]|nr:hypothetical protein [Myxococcales bacterium]